MGIVFFLVGCKVEIEVPDGGDVVTQSGTYRCLSGQRCVIEVTDTQFDETFIARPKAGYYFGGWEKKPKALCGGRRSPCRLFTSGFEGKEKAMKILASDEKYFLIPVFQTYPPTAQYDVTFWRRIAKEIESEKFTTNSYLYQYLPNVANCDPGQLKNAPKARARATLNETRKLHDLPLVEYDAFYDAEAQSASLVHRANNNTSHHPPPTARCYSELAASGTASSNLQRRGNNENDDPAHDIIEWVDDSFNNSNIMGVGHRRWALYPDLGYIAYGQVNGAAVQKVFRFGNEPSVKPPANLQFVAFPYRTYPYLLADLLLESDNKPTPWSLSLTPSGHQDYQYEYFRNASVTVSEWDTGVKLRVHNLYTDTRRLGTPNVLSWLVDGHEYDKKYRVRIDNITYPDGNQYYLEYYVYLDYYNIADITEPLEAGDKKDGNQLKGNLASKEDKDSYSVTLSGNKRISGESKFSNQAFYIHVYDAKKRLIASHDRSFQQNFEPGEYTVVASLCTPDGYSWCYSTPINYTITIN
jgi:hypothetical protein